MPSSQHTPKSRLSPDVDAKNNKARGGGKGLYLSGHNVWVEEALNDRWDMDDSS